MEPTYVEAQWDESRGTITLVARTGSDRYAVTRPAATLAEADALRQAWQTLYQS